MRLQAGLPRRGHTRPAGPAPDFTTYFSGSPVTYPPAGALAARVAGLTGARLLSLAMMLAAAGILHGVTRRLFDRRSAFFAAAPFAGLAGTQFLGALATCDAMAACLPVLASLCRKQASSVRPGP